MRKPFQMFEHDKLKKGEPCFTLTNDDIRQIKRFNRTMRKRDAFKPKILDLWDDADGVPNIRSFSYVGAIRAGKRTIQILPKVAKKGVDDDNCHEAIFRSAVRNLLFMLSFAKRLPIKEVDLSRLNQVDDDFFEFLIYLFAKNTLELLKRNMFKAYVEREENVLFLRGKIKFSSHVKQNAALKHRFYTEFDDFSVDNLLNQILKYTTFLLLGQSSSFGNSKKLREIYFILEEVTLREITPSHFGKLKLTRLNEEYKPVLNLCKLVIEHAAFELRAGQLETFSFIFDMDVLFEEFISEFIKRQFAGEFFDIAIKKPMIHFARKCGDGTKAENVLPLHPDIVLQKTQDGPRLVVDTKYKELAGKDKKEGADRLDIYQMYAYSRKYESPTVVLLYPQFKKQKKSFVLDVDDYTKIHVRTINVCRDLRRERMDLRRELAEALGCAG